MANNVSLSQIKFKIVEDEPLMKKEHALIIVTLSGTRAIKVFSAVVLLGNENKILIRA